MAEPGRSTQEVHFPPILNGVDYLLSVVDLLRRDDGSDPSQRDLKYAVLHLQAASEVLLKERLRLEHWTLVVKDAARTNRQKFQKGDFESATHAETVRRLIEVVGIEIRDADKKALDDLAKTRNALQHWGLTESAPAVEARAAKVLDFLISFLDDELLKKLDQDQDQDVDIHRRMLPVREGLKGIYAYVKRRMNRLRGELKDMADRTIKCPDCAQFALVLDGEYNLCHFCACGWDARLLAENYAMEFLSLSMRGPVKDEDAPAVECPNCGLLTLVLGAYTAADPRQPVDICFNCVEVFNRLESCTHCFRLFVPLEDEDELICSDCWRRLIDSH